MQQRMSRHAQVFFVIMLVELGSYAAYAAGALGQGLGLAHVLGRIATIFVLIRVVIVGGNFLQTWLARSPRAPEHRIGVFATLKLFFNEWLTCCKTYPFQFAAEVTVRNAPASAAGDKPVVLVPGFLCNRGYLRRLRKDLERRGYGPVYTVTLEPQLGSIDDNARMLAEFIESVCTETGHDKVTAIGHSMGGVTIRSYIHRFGGDRRLVQAVALGSPFGGTVLAEGLKGVGENLRQMCVNSDYLQALRADEDRPCPVPFTAIWSPHDSIVAPQNGTRVNETYGTNIALPGVGHMEMIDSAPVFDAIARALTAASVGGHGDKT